MSTAAAQSADDATNAEAANDESGEAEEFPSNPATRVGGTGSIGISSGQKQVSFATLNTDTTEFERYSEAAERDDLDDAAEALDKASGEREVTPDLVEHVNEELDVQTTLSPRQIAETANEDLPY